MTTADRLPVAIDAMGGDQAPAEIVAGAVRARDELGVPVRYIGLGERSEDLHEFDADEYVEAVFGELGKEASA